MMSAAAFAAMLLIGPTAARAQEAGRLTLDEALVLARERNRGLRIAELRVRERQRKSWQAFADYFPRLETEMSYSRSTETQSVLVPEGSLGLVDEGPFPLEDVIVPQGDQALLYGVTTLSQPVTQLIEISAANRVARADLDQAAADRRRAELELDYAVRQIYFGLLVAEKRREAAELTLEAAGGRLRDRTDAVATGTVLAVEEVSARASLLEARHELLSVEDQIADLSEHLVDVLGLPLDTPLELEPVEHLGGVPPATQPPSAYVEAALAGNPEIEAARALVEKAQAGVTEGWAQYVPDIAVVGQHAFQDGVPFLPDQLWTLGLRLKWDVLDFGKREAVIGEKRAALDQARLNRVDVESRIEREVHSSYRRLERARQMLDVGREAAALRSESARLRTDQVDTGFLVAWQSTSARADALSAQADLLEVELGYLLALADLERLVGRSLVDLPVDE
jgi:outer membrane protein TolC